MGWGDSRNAFEVRERTSYCRTEPSVTHPDHLQQLLDGSNTCATAIIKPPRGRSPLTS
jgi:hypothetical protein